MLAGAYAAALHGLIDWHILLTFCACTGWLEQKTRQIWVLRHLYDTVRVRLFALLPETFVRVVRHWRALLVLM